ncbi:hypothetical protein Nepgr_004518 [Nepenthes gracilis]|uniref:Uncharacterized protein n=1 Tax=Nepenthes gracilis TaxID=150966 RepID=A0AAD3S1U1_NEPGR|nr:hypothetical protein Nepgr_004518 [Nepenthes gracilis]
MPVKYAVVDAFTDTTFKGNPAAVCLLEEQRSEAWLQSVASEFNLSETCYLTRLTDLDPDSPSSRFKLRWFTPAAEVKLCGHATLAAAHFCFTSGIVMGDTIEFSTLSGNLTAKKKALQQEIEGLDTLKGENNGEPPDQQFSIELDFPAVPLTEYTDSCDIVSISKFLGDALVVDIKRTTSDDLFVVLPSAKFVSDLQPQFEKIKECPGRGLIISGLAAPESGFDFFSRFFCPKLGVNEDPVCGSAHCALVPYWSKMLGKCDFLAYAASPRSGVLKLHFDEKNKRVQIEGKAVTVMEGCLLV